MHPKRRDARVAEEARLESVCTPKGYREFESRSLRKKPVLTHRLFCVEYLIRGCFAPPKPPGLHCFNFLTKVSLTFRPAPDGAFHFPLLPQPENRWPTQLPLQWPQRPIAVLTEAKIPVVTHLIALPGPSVAYRCAHRISG